MGLNEGNQTFQKIINIREKKTTINAQFKVKKWYKALKCQ